LHQGGFRSCNSKVNGKSAKSLNAVKMSPAGDSGATGQTGSHDRSDQSSSDRPSEPTSQTGGSDRSDRSNAEWLQQRIEHYRARTNDMCETIKESEDMDKLGQGFTSADPLEKVDLGDGTIPKPTFVNKNLSVEFKRIYRLFCLGVF